MNRIKLLREENKLNQVELGKILGISGQALGMYENERRDISTKMLKKLSKYFNVSVDYILGVSNDRIASNVTTPRNIQYIPVIGKIKAGTPIFADENMDGTLPVDLDVFGLKSSDNLFLLLVSGNSMNLIIKNGEYALIEKQDYAENGDVVAVLLNDNEATLKRFKQLNNQFILLEPMSSDPSYEPITVDLKKDPSFRILGKAIGHFGKI